MADDTVEVRLGADTGDATSGIADAQSQISSSLNAIKAALDSLASKHKETAAASVSANNSILSSFTGLHEQLIARVGSINSAFLRFRDGLGAVAALFAGGAVFHSAISSMEELEDSVRTLQQTFGVTADDATRLSVQLKLAGSSADAFAAMATKVGRQLRTSDSELDRLGVTTRDATGAFLPMEQILQNVYTRMQDFKAGTDQTLFTLATVGRSSVEFANDMERMNASAARATQLQHDLGIEMGPDRQAQVEAYRLEVNSFKVTLEAIGDKIGEAVMPQLESLAAWFNSEGPTAIGYAINAIKGIATALTILISLFQSVKTAASVAMENVGIATQAAADIAHTKVVDAWTKIPEIIAQANAKIIANNNSLEKQMLDGYTDMADKIGKIWDDKVTPKVSGGAGARGGGTQSFTPKPVGGGTDSQLELWRDELAKLQEAEGYFHEFSKTQEAQFWSDKLAIAQAGGASMVKLAAQVDQLRFAAAKAAANEELQTDLATWQRMIDQAKNNQAQQIAIAESRTATIKSIFGEESPEYQRVLDLEVKLRQDWKAKDEALVRDAAKFHIDMAQQEIAGDQQALDQQVALRQVTSDQKFAIEQGFENKLYGLKLKELQDELALLDQGTLAYQQTLEKIETLEVAHQQKLTSIANAAVLERQQYALQADQAVESSFSTLFSDLANNTKTAKQAFLDFFNSLDQALVKIASNQIAQQLFGAGTTGGNAVNSLMSKIFGGGITGGAGGAAGSAADTQHAAAVEADTVATEAQTTAGTTLSTTSTLLDTAFTTLASAAQAAAASLQSVAASSAGGAAGGMGGFASLLSDIPSMDTGTAYVPQDTLAFVHRGEAIVPARYNNAGVGSRAMSVHNTFVLNGAMDTRTQDQIAAKTYTAAQRGAARIL